MGRKHCGKRRNCSLRAISPFPSVFKRLVSQGHQKASLSGNGLNHLQRSTFSCYEQFLLFPQCFQKACFPGASKGVIVWEWVKSSSKINLQFTHSLIYHFETVPNSKKLQTTPEMWLLKDRKISIA